MSESQLLACVPCGILVAFCGPSEAQLGPPSVRDGPWTSLCYRSAWDLPSVRNGPWTSPQLGMGLGPPLDQNCRLISSPTMMTALQPNPEHLQNQLQLPRISRKLLIRTPPHTALCPCLKCPGDEARSSIRWCGAELANPPSHSQQTPLPQ